MAEGVQGAGDQAVAHAVGVVARAHAGLAPGLLREAKLDLPHRPAHSVGDNGCRRGGQLVALTVEDTEQTEREANVSAPGERDGQLAARVYIAKQRLSHGAAAVLAREPRDEDGRDAVHDEVDGQRAAVEDDGHDGGFPLRRGDHRLKEGGGKGGRRGPRKGVF